MRKVNIHEAKTHLSRLVEEAAKNSPLSSPSPVNQWSKSPPWTHRRVHKYAGWDSWPAKSAAPEDFDRMGRVEIERLFGGAE
jgi:hypothetical protein